MCQAALQQAKSLHAPRERDHKTVPNCHGRRSRARAGFFGPQPSQGNVTFETEANPDVIPVSELAS